MCKGPETKMTTMPLKEPKRVGGDGVPRRERGWWGPPGRRGGVTAAASACSGSGGRCASTEGAVHGRFGMCSPNLDFSPARDSSPTDAAFCRILSLFF